MALRGNVSQHMLCRCSDGLATAYLLSRVDSLEVLMWSVPHSRKMVFLTLLMSAGDGFDKFWPYGRTVLKTWYKAGVHCARLGFGCEDLAVHFEESSLSDGMRNGAVSYYFVVGVHWP
jgi:hypothetical protein